ncbi:MAG: hypothetical protein V9G12_23190 [Microthrixaceae bacterium]
MSLAFQRVANLRRAQVHQDSPESLRIPIETAADSGPDDLAFLERELRKRLGISSRSSSSRSISCPWTRGGKERLVVSSIGQASA